MTAASINEIRSALEHIPATDRDTWVRCGMAIKAELGEPGFATWDDWARSAENHNERDALDVWRSLSPEGGITINTLFALARQHGYQPLHNGRSGQKTPMDVWQAGTPDGANQHPYLIDKGIKAHGLRRRGGTLLIPVRDADGTLLSVQRIYREDDGRWVKRFLKDTKLGAGFHQIGEAGDGPLVVCEGYATGASIHGATGLGVFVAFDCGRLASVAQAMRAKFPKHRIVVAADNDTHLAVNAGVEKATAAAKAVGGKIVVPSFESGTGGDFNDLATAEGLLVVKEQIDAAMDADPAATTGDKRPTVSILRGADIRPEPIDWLWHEWLARSKFHVLAGPPGTGKTTIAAALGATLSCGGRWPDGTWAKPGRVLIWSGEDDPTDTLVPRMMACDADMERVFFVGPVHDGDEIITFDPAYHADLLERAALGIGGVSLLVVDPIVSAIAGDSHKNAEVRRGLQPLVTLADRLDCAVLGISHFSKGTSGRDPVERVTGSIAFGALARLVFAAAKMPDDDREGGGRIFVRSKSNIGPDNGGFRYDLEQVELDAHPGVFASHLQWGSAIDGNAKELLGRAEATPKDEEQEADADSPEVDTWLRDFLSHGPKTAKEVFTAGRDDGHSRDQLKRAKSRLGVVSGKHEFAGPWAWSMPEGTFATCNGEPIFGHGVSPDEGGAREHEPPNKKEPLPSHPSLKPAQDKGFADCTLHTEDAPLRPSSEPSNDAGFSESETRRERREHDFQSVGDSAPFTRLVDPFTGTELDPSTTEDF